MATIAKKNQTPRETASKDAPARKRPARRPASKTKRDKSNYTIQSVAHALDVLEVFESDGSEFGVTELSRKLKLHKNNVFRLLATLEARGYVEQNKATENYRLGVKCLELGQAFVRQTGVLRQARPVLEELADEVGETSYVAVLRSRQVVYIDAVQSSKTVRVVRELGAQFPIHATAAGKAQLAYESDAERDRVLGQPLEACAPATLVDPDVLREQLATVPTLGYAVEDEEHEEGVRAVAAPIRDYTGRIVAAITVVAPAYRLSVEDVERDAGPRVAKAGLDISNRLGFGIDQAATA